MSRADAAEKRWRERVPKLPRVKATPATPVKLAKLSWWGREDVLTFEGVPVVENPTFQNLDGATMTPDALLEFQIAVYIPATVKDIMENAETLIQVADNNARVQEVVDHLDTAAALVEVFRAALPRTGTDNPEARAGALRQLAALRAKVGALAGVPAGDASVSMDRVVAATRPEMTFPGGVVTHASTGEAITRRRRSFSKAPAA